MNFKDLFAEEKYDQIVDLGKKLNDKQEEELLIVTKALHKLGNISEVKTNIEKYIHEHKYYYEYLLMKVDILMSEEKYIDAALIIKEELNMPYLEEKYKVAFEDYFQVILDKKYKKEVSIADIDQLLNSDEDNQILGITLLKKQNVREYVDIISEILSSGDHSLRIKNLLINLMYEQEYETKLELTFDEYYELISIKEHTLKQRKLVNDIMKNNRFDDDVTISNVYNDIVVSVVLNTFPQEISEKQYSHTINALVAQMFNRDVEEENINMELLDYFKALVY